MLTLILLQAAAQAPDIQLEVRARVREVVIEQEGEASLEVRGGAGSEVRVERPQANGRRKLRNVNVVVRAEARVTDPQQISSSPETPQAE